MSYLPLTDSGLLDWSRNFQTQLSELADPTTVGLTAQHVTDYTAAQLDYETKYIAANTPATRGGATIHAKDESKKDLVAISRSFAMTITKFQGVTDQQRYEFGLTIPSDPSPVTRPTHAPSFDMTGHAPRDDHASQRAGSRPSRQAARRCWGVDLFLHWRDAALAAGDEPVEDGGQHYKDDD